MRLPDIRRWLGRRPAPAMNRAEAMALRPVRNPAITWEVQASGLVLLTVPVVQKPWMKVASVLSPTPETRGVELDELGSAVWGWCDGDTPVSELVARFAREHRVNPREAEVSLTQFLQTLAQRRFVGLRVVEVEEQQVNGAPTAKKRRRRPANGKRRHQA